MILLRRSFQLALCGAIAVSALVLLGHTVDIWPFELFAHFSIQVAFANFLIAAITMKILPRLAGAAAVFGLIAALPILTLSNFERPSGAACNDACLSVMAANIWTKPEALSALSELSQRYRPDILAIIEPPKDISSAEVKVLFPDFDTALIATPETMGRTMGRSLIMLVRGPVVDEHIVLPDDTWNRAYITATVDMAGKDIKIAALHPIVPVIREGRVKRDAMFGHVSKSVSGAENFIIIGDYNTTPWVPAFKHVPGKRAGDPRFAYTWPQQIWPMRVPIDHIKFDGALELVAAETLPDIGSDHLPIMARFKAAPIGD